MAKAVSSLFRSYDYDDQSGTLTITYPSGQTYAHANVPPSKVDAMEQAASAGQYFLREIKEKHLGKRV